MDISEKVLNLRKANNLTQEQLAEQLHVSRQSVSKWETGQAMPDADKLAALSDIFHVTTDYLLKPSKIDELTIKTEMLERQQQKMREDGKKTKTRRNMILSCVSIYLVTVAVCMLVNRISWQNDFLFETFPGLTFPIIAFVIATAVSIAVCIKRKGSSS